MGFLVKSNIARPKVESFRPTVRQYFRQEKLLYKCLFMAFITTSATLAVSLFSRSDEKEFARPIAPVRYLMRVGFAPPEFKDGKSKFPLGEVAAKPRAVDENEAAAPDNTPKTIEEFMAKQLEVEPVKNTDAQAKAYRGKLNASLERLKDKLDQFSAEGKSDFDPVKDLLPVEYAAQHLEKMSYLMPDLTDAQMLSLFEKDVKTFEKIAKDPSLTKKEKLMKLKEFVNAKAPYDPGAQVLSSIFGLGQSCVTTTKYELALAMRFQKDLLEDGERFVVAAYSDHFDAAIYNPTTGEAKLFDANNYYPNMLEPTRSFVPNLADPHYLAQIVVEKLDPKAKKPDKKSYVVAYGNMAGDKGTVRVKGPDSPLSFGDGIGSEFSYVKNGKNVLSRREWPKQVKALKALPQILKGFSDEQAAGYLIAAFTGDNGQSIYPERASASFTLDEIDTATDFIRTPTMQAKLGALPVQVFDRSIAPIFEIDYYVRSKVGKYGRASSVFYDNRPGGQHPEQIVLIKGVRPALNSRAARYDFDFFAKAIVLNLQGKSDYSLDLFSALPLLSEKSAKKLKSFLVPLIGKIYISDLGVYNKSQLTAKINKLNVQLSRANREAREVTLLLFYAGYQAKLRNNLDGGYLAGKLRDEHRAFMGEIAKNPLLLEAKAIFERLAHPVAHKYSYGARTPNGFIEVFDAGKFIGYVRDGGFGWDFTPLIDGINGDIVAFEYSYMHAPTYYRLEGSNLVQISEKEVEGLFKGRNARFVLTADKLDYSKNIVDFIETDSIETSPIGSVNNPIVLPPGSIDLAP